MEEEKVKENLFKKKEIWISLIIGLIIGGLIIFLLGTFGIMKMGNGTVATFKGGKVTENTLYKEMKKSYPVTYVLELVDGKILEKQYKLTEEQETEIKEQADSLIAIYQANYGYSEEEFLSSNGFETKDEFVNYLKLDYRRNLYCVDYFKTILDKKDIEEYYNNNIYGEIKTKHILAQTTNGMSDAEALAVANEVIAKLNSGANFDDVAEEYKDKTISENVDFDNFIESNLASEYTKAAKETEKGTFTKQAVKTDFGYHIIYVVEKQDKPALENIENDIAEQLGKKLEADDQYIRYKALIKLREDNGLKFSEDTYKKAYEDYCAEVNG